VALEFQRQPSAAQRRILSWSPRRAMSAPPHLALVRM
jgi:hypothetical protein